LITLRLSSRQISSIDHARANQAVWDAWEQEPEVILKELSQGQREDG